MDPPVSAPKPLADQIDDALYGGLDWTPLTGVLTGGIVGAFLLSGNIMRLRGNADLLGMWVLPRGPGLLGRLGAMKAARIEDGELWRFVSAVFLHGDLLHLGLNALALVALGRLCESIYGRTRFFWIFLLSGVFGFVLSWAGGNTLSVGASGGLFGLLGAAIVFGWRYREQLPEGPGVFFRRKLAPWVALNLLIGVFVPFIDNLGHTGGLLTGIVLGAIVGNRVVPGEQGPRWTRWAMALISLGLVGWAAFGVWGKWF